MRKEASVFEIVGKLLVAAAAILHLIFTYVHNNALVLLEDQICCFVMFMFVLFGLIGLFEVTQIKTEHRTAKFVSAGVCVITIILGLILVNIYKQGIATQASIDVRVVNKAIYFSYGLIGAFGLGGILLLIDGLKTERYVEP